MLGLFQNIGYALESMGLSIENAFVKARCNVSNHIVDAQCRRKIKQYEKLQSGVEDEELDEEEDF